MAYPDDDDEMPRHDRRGWHVDKTVNISHILTTLSAIFLVIVFGLSLAGRVSLLEYLAKQQTILDGRQDSERRELQQDLKGDLNKIDAKIDKVLQRTAP